MDEVIVIGSGPAGLAMAAELLRRRLPVSVLERGERPAAAWASRYDGLRFNTSRWWSALPGAPFPREHGWFPTRDQYVDYLDTYVARHHVPVSTGTAVHRIDRRADGQWLVATNHGSLSASRVVVATGLYNRPVVPGWLRTGEFSGTIVHSSDYRNASCYRDKKVVVIGPGSTGMEIAHELVVGGAAGVFLSVRTPPHVLLRATGGLPTDLPVPLFLKLPVRMVDALLVTIPATGAAFGVGAVGTVSAAAMSDVPAVWNQSVATVGSFALGQTLLLLVGFVLGALIRSSAGAVVAFMLYGFVVPGLLAFLAINQQWFAEARPWVDAKYSQDALLQGRLTGEGWSHLAVTSLVWLVVPMLIAVVSLLRSEVK